MAIMSVLGRLGVAMRSLWGVADHEIDELLTELSSLRQPLEGSAARARLHNARSLEATTSFMSQNPLAEVHASENQGAVLELDVNARVFHGSSWGMGDNHNKVELGVPEDPSARKDRTAVLERFPVQERDHVKRNKNGEPVLCPTYQIARLFGGHLFLGAPPSDTSKTSHLIMDVVPATDVPLAKKHHERDGRYRAPSAAMVAALVRGATVPTANDLCGDGVRIFIVEGEPQAKQIMKAAYMTWRLDAQAIAPDSYRSRAHVQPTGTDSFGVNAIRFVQGGPLALAVAFPSTGAVIHGSPPHPFATTALLSVVAGANFVRQLSGLPPLALEDSPIAAFVERKQPQLVEKALAISGSSDTAGAQDWLRKRQAEIRDTMPQCFDKADPRFQEWRDKLPQRFDKDDPRFQEWRDKVIDKAPACRDKDDPRFQEWRDKVIDKSQSCGAIGTPARDEWSANHRAANSKRAREALPAVQPQLRHPCPVCNYASDKSDHLEV